MTSNRRRFSGQRAGLVLVAVLTLLLTGCSTSTTRSAMEDARVEGIAAIKGIAVQFVNASEWPVAVTATWPNNAGTTKKKQTLKPRGEVYYENVSIPFTLNGNLASFMGTTVAPQVPDTSFQYELVFFNEIGKSPWFVGKFTAPWASTQSWKSELPVGHTQATIDVKGTVLSITRNDDSLFYKNYRVIIKNA